MTLVSLRASMVTLSDQSVIEEAKDSCILLLTCQTIYFKTTPSADKQGSC